MFGAKKEFENENSQQFNQEGAKDAIEAINREFGGESSVQTPNGETGEPNYISSFNKKLIERLPKHLVQKFGSVPETIATGLYSKSLSKSQKVGLETILSCPDDLCEKRLELLDKVLSKYVGSSWEAMKEQDFLEIEVLLEAWSFNEKRKEAKDYREKCLELEGANNGNS